MSGFRPLTEEDFQKNIGIVDPTKNELQENIKILKEQVNILQGMVLHLQTKVNAFKETHDTFAKMTPVLIKMMAVHMHQYYLDRSRYISQHYENQIINNLQNLDKPGIIDDFR